VEFGEDEEINIGGCERSGRSKKILSQSRPSGTLGCWLDGYHRARPGNAPIAFKVAESTKCDEKRLKVREGVFTRKPSVYFHKPKTPRRPTLAGKIVEKSLAVWSDQTFPGLDQLDVGESEPRGDLSVRSSSIGGVLGGGASCCCGGGGSRSDEAHQTLSTWHPLRFAPTWLISYSGAGPSSLWRKSCDD